MRIQLILSWFALLLIPVGIYIESSSFTWGVGFLAAVLVIKIGLTPCKNCKERIHFYVRKGLLGKVKIGFPFGRCDHCGESYL